jgi:hypothetical protein
LSLIRLSILESVSQRLSRLTALNMDGYLLIILTTSMQGPIGWHHRAGGVAVGAIQLSDETESVNRRGRRGSQRENWDSIEYHPILCDPLRPLR